MANSLVSNVVHDGQRNVLVEVTGILDTSDLAQIDITSLVGLNPIPSQLRVDRIQFAVEDGLSCMLWWHATIPVLIVPIAGRSRFDYDWFGGRNNPQAAGSTGDIMLSTSGWIGIKHFSILLELIKQ